MIVACEPREPGTPIRTDGMGSVAVIGGGVENGGGERYEGVKLSREAEQEDEDGHAARNHHAVEKRDGSDNRECD